MNLMKTYYSESVHKQWYTEAEVQAENKIPEVILEIFNEIEILPINNEIENGSISTDSTAGGSPKYKETKIPQVIVHVDEAKIQKIVTNTLPSIKDSHLNKVFTEDQALSNLIFIIEVVKKAWKLGAVQQSEFVRFIDLMKENRLFTVIPFIFGCYRLRKEMEIPNEGFSQIVELCFIIIHQASSIYDVFVPSRLMTLAETYYRVKPDCTQEYIFERLKKAPIFKSLGFWEAYLLWSIQRSQKDYSHYKKDNVDIYSIRENAQESVATVFLTVIYEMCTAGLDGRHARSIITLYVEKFKLNEKNKTNIINFLTSQFSAKKQ